MAAVGPPPPSTPHAEPTGSQSGVHSSHANTTSPITIDWNAFRLEQAIVSELADDVFTDVSGFLEAMFPVSDDLLDTVWAQVSKRKGLYDASEEQWRSYPVKPPKHEKDLYEPFVTLVESISKCIPAEERNEVGWHDCHDRTPLSFDPSASKVRPDIVATLGDGVRLESKQPKKKDAEVRIPWSRILVPIEMKKRYYHGRVDGDCPALLQLLKYMRMIFHEAVDRSFVLGIVVAHASVSVYVADRTGVLGSRIFNIHEDPRDFIRVVVGICTMSPAQLGWDTSMTVLKEKERYTRAFLRGWKPKLSYQIPLNTTKEDHYWVVDMPKPKEGAEYGVMEEEATERFVLFRALNLQRGQVIRGRATRIWKAWLFDELVLSPHERKVFILKDSWRDDDRRLEGEFYERIGRVPGVAAMYSYGVVEVDGEADTVASRSRRGLSIHAKPRAINELQRELRAQMIPTSTPDKSWGSTPDYTIFADILPFMNVTARTPRGKTHSRLVLETYGWPLKMALSPLEIVQAMQDVVAGHQAALEQGVVHRDLSEGNVLITGSKEVGKRAVIIDFDYAKMLEDATLAQDLISGTRPFISGEILGKTMYFKVYDVDDDGEKKKPILVVIPVHRFHHDLESVFWILFWMCLCRSGPAVRRAELFDRPEGDDVGCLGTYIRLFTAIDDDQLAYNKGQIIKYRMEFEEAVTAVSAWCRPLKSLLRQLSKILREHYENNEFPVAETYRAFMSALQESEQLLLAKATDEEKETPAYRAEVDRRIADRTDWELPLRKLPEPEVILEANEALAHPSDEASRSAAGNRPGDSREEPPKRRGLVAKLKALRLSAGPPSPTSSDSAGSGHTATGKQGPQSSSTQPTATNPAATKPQATKAPSTKAPTTKRVSKKAQAAKVTQPMNILTRAMQRAASAVPGSSRGQTLSQGASDTAPKKAGPSRSTARTQDGSEARGVTATRGTKAVTIKATGTPGMRTRRKAREEDD
ncbi:hypothetical protein FOMPIDRAFT_1025203 [Fomitopsis schrenkii]|uniref:Fungal-type protein kinase domain-containing protein n=1 Tax=Fomitopsis schrenkii TaxID=2126942 RepID=S8DUM2_FOMSC|nr:hypothetical protein FOMPIDRAFT_1025203 [Fomitopsis schrenkii]